MGEGRDDFLDVMCDEKQCGCVFFGNEAAEEIEEFFPRDGTHTGLAGAPLEALDVGIRRWIAPHTDDCEARVDPAGVKPAAPFQGGRLDPLREWPPGEQPRHYRAIRDSTNSVIRLR